MPWANAVDSGEWMVDSSNKPAINVGHDRLLGVVGWRDGNGEPGVPRAAAQDNSKVGEVRVGGFILD